MITAAFAWGARVAYLILVALLVIWGTVYLGGYSAVPVVVDETTNDTNALFNLHPLLMVIAFLVLMMESIMVYKAPIVPIEEKDTKKMVHFSLHILSFVCAVTGVVFAFLSHTMKLPDPIANLYSPHSYMGIFTLVVFLTQVVMGIVGFLVEDNEAKKMSYSVLHKPAGVAVFLLGCGTILMGFQEKAGFIYGDALYSPMIWMIGVMCILVFITASLGLAPYSMGALGAVMDKALDAVGDVAEQAEGLLENVPGASRFGL